MRFSAEVQGDKHTEHLLHQLGERATDVRPVGREIADTLLRGQAAQFRSGGAYLGTPWEPIADATKERYGPHRPLHLTGKLERAALKGFRRVSKQRVTVGIKDWRAIFQQGGTSRGVPARPIAGIARRDRRSVLSMIERFLTG